MPNPSLALLYDLGPTPPQEAAVGACCFSHILRAPDATGTPSPPTHLLPVSHLEQRQEEAADLQGWGPQSRRRPCQQPGQLACLPGCPGDWGRGFPGDKRTLHLKGPHPGAGWGRAEGTGG